MKAKEITEIIETELKKKINEELKAWTLVTRATKNPPYIYQDRFNFHAKDEKEAMSKALDWARYHSFFRGDISVKPCSTEAMKFGFHDEYVD